MERLHTSLVWTLAVVVGTLIACFNFILFLSIAVPKPPVAGTLEARPISSTPVKDSLQSLDAERKAQTKAIAVASKTYTGTYTDPTYGITIEIKQVEVIPEGVQLYARAWNAKGEQLGFGSDGSVEWERFRVYNPPIMVPDGTKRIASLPNSPEITFEVDNYKEDPALALKQSLVHTISTTGKTNTKVQSGTYGHTTDTYYPDANPESTSVDGVVLTNYGAGLGKSWAASVGQVTAQLADDTSAVESIIDIQADSTSNQWRNMHRSIFLFDTSSLPDGDTITSATLSFRGTVKVTTGSFCTTIDVATTSPASNTAVAVGDYGSGRFSTTTMSSSNVTVAAFSTSGYNDWVLNSTGISAISLTGISRFGFRCDNDRNNTSPTWVSGLRTEAGGNFADNAGTSADPKLVVVHSGAVTTTFAPWQFENF